MRFKRPHHPYRQAPTDRPVVALPFGSTYRESECGRFWAVRSKYSMPSSSIDWTLIDTKTRKAHKNMWDFASCGEMADELAGETT